MRLTLIKSLQWSNVECEHGNQKPTYGFINDGIRVMFVISFAVYEIFANHAKFQKFDLGNEGRRQGGKKNGTSAIGLEMFHSMLMDFSEF